MAMAAYSGEYKPGRPSGQGGKPAERKTIVATRGPNYGQSGAANLWSTTIGRCGSRAGIAGGWQLRDG